MLLIGRVFIPFRDLDVIVEVGIALSGAVLSRHLYRELLT